jgi:hypothetical protein
MECGLKSFKVQRKLDLLFIHKLARLNWANANLYRDWSCVIFSDEASIWINEVYGRMWLKTGDQAHSPAPQHARKIHMWAAISI